MKSIGMLCAVLHFTKAARRARSKGDTVTTMFACCMGLTNSARLHFKMEIVWTTKNWLIMRIHSIDLPVVSAEAAANSYDHYVASTTIDRLSLALKRVEAFGHHADLAESGASLARDLVIDALERRVALSLVRIGDGEGNILSAFEPRFQDARDHSTREILSMMFATSGFSTTEILRMRLDMIEALVNADILGVSDWVRVGRLETLRQSPDGRSDVRGYMGSYESILQVDKVLRASQPRRRLIVSNHIHRYLLDFYASIASRADEVLLIGPYDLSSALQQRFGAQKVRTLTIPNQASSTPAEGAKWFPDAYDRLLANIKVGPGVLTLVAAGLLGKALCRHAQLQGAVALDIGSVIDVWRGKAVRNYHLPAFVDRFRIADS